VFNTFIRVEGGENNNKSNEKHANRMGSSQDSSADVSTTLEFRQKLKYEHHAHGTHDGSENKINCSNNNF
jgi:hypothetical protein